MNRVRVRFGDTIREFAPDTVHLGGRDALGMREARFYSQPQPPEIPGYRIIYHMPDHDGVCFTAVKE